MSCRRSEWVLGVLLEGVVCVPVKVWWVQGVWCDVLCGWGCMRGEKLGEEAEEWCGLECGDVGLDCCGEEIKK